MVVSDLCRCLRHVYTRRRYKQATFDVATGRYPCSDDDCAYLAALQLRVDVGDAGTAELLT